LPPPPRRSEQMACGGRGVSAGERGRSGDGGQERARLDLAKGLPCGRWQPRLNPASAVRALSANHPAASPFPPTALVLHGLAEVPPAREARQEVFPPPPAPQSLTGKRRLRQQSRPAGQEALLPPAPRWCLRPTACREPPPRCAYADGCPGLAASFWTFGAGIVSLTKGCCSRSSGVARFSGSSVVIWVSRSANCLAFFT